MSNIPHDVADLALAPVVLAVEAEIESFDGLSQEQIAYRVTVETNREPRTVDEQREALLEALLRFVDLHGWEAQWSARGLRLSHGPRSVTLGIAANVREYVGAD